MDIGRGPRRVSPALTPGFPALPRGAPPPPHPPPPPPPANLSAVIDFRVVLTDGERAFTDGGFGKSRFGGGGGGGTDVHAVPAAAELVWHGPIAWGLSGTVSAAYQDDQDQPVDLIQAFAT